MEKKPRLKIYNPITMNGVLIGILVVTVIFYILLFVYYPLMAALFTLVIITIFLLYTFYGPAKNEVDQANKDTDVTEPYTSSAQNPILEDQKYKQIINGMDVVALTFYMMLWVIYILIAIYFRNWFQNSLLTIIINLIVFIGLMLLIFYNPIKTNLDSNIKSSQKGYLSYVQDTEDVISDHLKSKFTNALNKKNEYFVIVFMILLYAPVIYYVVHLINNIDTISDAILFYTPLAFTLVSIGLLIFVIVWFVNYGFNIWILILGILSLLFSGLQIYKRVFH